MYVLIARIIYLLVYAAEHGLLLKKVIPFEAKYNLSSHRGVDRGFKIGESPKLYIFTKANIKIERQYQVS